MVMCGGQQFFFRHSTGVNTPKLVSAVGENAAID
jgi:hypothetical protein